MTVSNISGLFQVKSSLLSDASAKGSIDTLITQTVRGESLNSFYSQVITGATLTTTDQVFNGFPTVDLNGSPVNGQDGTQLTLNSINGIVVQVVENAGSTSAGFASVTLTDIGTEVAETVNIVAGDSFVLLSERGFPGEATSALTVGATGLTNCSVIISMLGKTATVGTGYNPA